MLYLLIDAWLETLAQILLALGFLWRACLVALPAENDLLDLYFVSMIFILDVASTPELCDDAILFV